MRRTLAARVASGQRRSQPLVYIHRQCGLRFAEPSVVWGLPLYLCANRVLGVSRNFGHFMVSRRRAKPALVDQDRSRGPC